MQRKNGGFQRGEGGLNRWSGLRGRDSHSEWSKSERERKIPFDITYIWNLIYDTKETFHRKENHGLGE